MPKFPLCAPIIALAVAACSAPAATEAAPADTAKLDASGDHPATPLADAPFTVQSEVLGSLTDLARYEQPKKIALLPYDLTVENGFLTPSLKVKRRVVEEKLSDVIDELYAGEAADGLHE